MRSISDLMEVNSAFRATRWVSLTVPVAASVASVTARLSRVVTCDMAPSATCMRPTPSVALRADWVRAVTLAFNPSAIARPAASSAPELMREPDESRSKVVFRDAPVIDNWFCAARDVMLFRMLSAIGNSSHLDPARQPNALHSVALPLGGAGGFRIEEVIGNCGNLNSRGGGGARGGVTNRMTGWHGYSTSATVSCWQASVPMAVSRPCARGRISCGGER